MLVKLPACALTTPEAEGCSAREVVPSDNDVKTGTLTANVTAVADTSAADPGAGSTDSGLSTQLGTTSGASVYALATGSSSDQGDYRASSLAASGSWSVSTGSGAFTYNLPIQLPAPAMGSAPSRSGPRRRRPAKLHADKGYDYDHLRRWLRSRGITHRIARRGIESSKRLGRHRWTIERTMAWLAGCCRRRRHRRYERKAEHFLVFTSIACALICYRRLTI